MLTETMKMGKFFDFSKNYVWGGLLTLVIVGIPLLNIFWQPSPTAAFEQVLSDNYYTFTPDRYTEAVNGADAIMLTFYADWCATCTGMEPDIVDTFVEVGTKHNIVGFRVPFSQEAQTPEAQELAKKFGVKAQTTTIILTKNGDVFDTFFSKVSKQELKDTLISATLV